MSTVVRDLVAVAGSGTDAPDWRVIAAVTTAVVAVVAFVVRELKARREDLDTKVDRAVDAAFGKTLRDLRAIESTAKDTLDAAVEGARMTEAQLRERLEASQVDQAKLAELLQTAAGIVPQLEASQTAVPPLLLERLPTASPQEGLSLLSALLASREASSSELETGGGTWPSTGSAPPTSPWSCTPRR